MLTLNFPGEAQPSVCGQVFACGDRCGCGVDFAGVRRQAYSSVSGGSQGSMISIPVSRKSLTFRVARTALRTKQIAAICASLGAALATRNLADFEGFDIALVDPWDGP